MRILFLVGRVYENCGCVSRKKGQDLTPIDCLFGDSIIIAKGLCRATKKSETYYTLSGKEITSELYCQISKQKTELQWL